MTEIQTHASDEEWEQWELGKAEAVAEDRREHEARSRGTQTLRVVDLAPLVRDGAPVIPWLVDGLLAKGAVTLFSGREKAGKSLFAIFLAAEMSKAMDRGAWHRVADFRVSPGKVLYIDAENGDHEMARRLHALDMPANVTVVSSEGFDLERNLSELGAVIDAHEPDLVVLDSFSSLWPNGDENDRGSVERTLSPLRNFVRSKGVAVLLLHHTTKEGSGYRGSTAIGASVQVLVTLSRGKESGVRWLNWEGSRLGPEPDAMKLALGVVDGRVGVKRL